MGRELLGRGGARAVSVIAATLTLVLGQAAAAVAGTQAGVTSPPMGWASWNSFAAAINANVIKA